MSQSGRGIEGLNVVRRSARGKGGDRPPVLFVHGAWHGAWCWEAHFLDHFAKAGFDCLALDLRGHGDSDAVAAMRWNRIGHYADDVMRVVESLERPPVLIGHSMGGLVSQHCLKRTDNLAGVGLLATVPYYGVWPVTLKVAWRHPIVFAEANLKWTLWPLVRDPAHAREMFLEAEMDEGKATAITDQLGDESYLAFLDMLGLGLPGRFETDVPVVVVAGEKDTLFSVASQQATARRYGAQCHVVKDAPHDLMLASQWQQAADLFIEWIDTLPAR